MKKRSLIQIGYGIFILGVNFNLNCLHAKENSPINKKMAIEKHLKDATQINKERALKYSKISRGQSLLLSIELIAMENLA